MTHKVILSLISGPSAWQKMHSTHPKYAKLQAKIQYLVNKLRGDAEATTMTKSAVLQRLKSTQRRLWYPCYANKNMPVFIDASFIKNMPLFLS